MTTGGTVVARGNFPEWIIGIGGVKSVDSESILVKMREISDRLIKDCKG